MANQQQQATNQEQSILDVIHEKVANTEQSCNSRTIAGAIKDALKVAYRREASLRQSTITVKTSEATISHDKLVQAIEQEWVSNQKRLSPTYWQDKEHTYAQFQSPKIKNEFLDSLSSIKLPGLVNHIKLADAEGLHFKRRPVRIEIANVRANIQADTIKILLDKNIWASDGKLVEFKEGKPNPITKSRGIYLQVDDKGFEFLFSQLHGTISYVDKNKSIMAKLNLKVVCKPWVCKDCYTIGRHQCSGKLCAQCGQKGHNSKDCKSRTKYCNNCKRRGHRAKDLHCKTYLMEAMKELRKMDIPLHYLEDDDGRLILSKVLQLK